MEFTGNDALSADFDADAALAALRRLVGREGTDSERVQFHPGQLEAIEALVGRRRRALVVQRTGWGKSAVYFVATALLRAQGAGPTLIISPLLALMRDQIAAAQRAGVRAQAINSANATEWEQIRGQLAADQVDVLLVSPERLNNPRFREEQLPQLVERMGLLVVDEAHCISDWGHDFRPDYRRIKDLIEQLPQDVPVLATTATANERVVRDVEEQLAAGGQDVFTLRGPLARKSLRLGVLRMASPRKQLGWLVQHVGQLAGSGIIYALTVSAAEDIAQMLREAGLNVRAYTGRTDQDERHELEDALKNNQVKALVATSALGMGFDKPDLGFVVHVGAPSSPVAYYQQVGRAGRGAARADVMLLPGPEDREIWRYFASASMPQESVARAVLDALAEAGGPVSVPVLEARVNVRRTVLDLLLKVLAVDGAVERVQGGWVGTGVPWVYDRERYERVAAAREAEQEAMLAYEQTEECRMRFLSEQLDDPHAEDCGICDNCAGRWFPTEVGDEATQLAQGGLNRVGVEIVPRKMYPTGLAALGLDVKGRIPAELQAGEGRALARFTDLGWGTRLRELLQQQTPDAPVAPDVVNACVKVVGEWSAAAGWMGPEGMPSSERPVGIVAMPSTRHPQLIYSLASELARIGQMRFMGALAYSGAPPRSGPGGNSAYRFADVRDAFVVPSAMGEAVASAPGPLLLVDDVVDSRWSITSATATLRQAGAPGVLPFALAVVG
ncbi:RecQ family ATP-dependent DNA helicase [Pseudoglutamicibacter albus]|uniref:RecQ family ATP-dependent DNA helicase n=1 Tax=Pseudoglutamicibacter albus TaxID=98671 RepID=UPI001EF6E69C|nr:RecQ family ATP-dependent DNA helicase [Pseudoglutamicibacter albus]MCG7305532.1 RecQ family ATP-dependent DNA helicase [Pseudoglutamicibacter albus]